MTSSQIPDEATGARVLEQRLARFRALREELEVAVLPLATSIDGRRFSFQASLHGLELRLGGYVVLEHEGNDRLGQILSLELDQREGTELDLPADGDAPAAVRTQVMIRYARGDGAILEGDGAPVHDATVRPAAAHEIRAWLERCAPRRAALEIGELALAPGVPCALDAGGFDRHTFLCGQSGSGKTYSLGVILEQLLIETGLRIIVLDPNSDFVRLSEVRANIDAAVAERYRDAARGVAVYSGRAHGEQRLRLRLAELSPAAQAALLRLDPIADRDEHAELDALLAEGTPTTVEALLASPRPEGQRLALRARNLGVERFALWGGSQPGSLLDVIDDPAARCVVVDLGSLDTREEQALAAGAVLGRLWQRREEREPVLIVIDEAHNVCPARPEDRLTALATEHAVRIAAEGRKFGLYLTVSTQRPQKVHENVISQCDNLVLMRLNSAADAAFTQAIFSFVPPSLIEQAASFGLGEALVAGKISPHPALLRFGARVAEEGGSDVPSTWARGRPGPGGSS
ncbi:MAG TPA: ATP-binding protein [Solirubrobacteraceae bacterium]|nr:ATP-binding protein [Solirubrobacteraceae bacterium]